MKVNLKTSNVRGEVFYDADCGLCSRGVTRWGGIFERHGFHWLPLQTPGTATRLCASEMELRSEMKLLLADGRIAGGADAWQVLFRAVWWLWPLGVLLGWPAIRTLSAAFYRWFARNRHCISGACGLPNHESSHHRHTAFLELP